MLNGLTSQLIPTVTAMPRQCSATRCSAAKSTLSSIGTIISQISAATGMLTCARVIRPKVLKRPRQQPAENDAGDHAQRHP